MPPPEDRTTPAEDAVDAATRQWKQAWPELDVQPGEVLARIHHLGQLIEKVQNQRLRRRPGMPVDNLGDFDVLRTLRRAGAPYALTPGQIRQAMLVSSAGLSGRLKRLEATGWINRTASPHDARSVLVALTPEGLADLDRDLPEHYAFEDGLLEVLSADERGELARALRSLILSTEG
ncbi:MarR family transcriptional regulator [Kocuria sp. CPCC 205268]|uniref:MarR family winged helix-turn-helix transcriptional regulator n=1 Tax=Kocuria oxytropis TaxID=3058913 RepID=UPI0034D398C0